MDVSTVLAVLADLAPASRVIPLDLRRDSLPVVHLSSDGATTVDATTLTGTVTTGLVAVERLAAVDALRRDERVLRHGRLVLWGRATVDGRRRRIFLPIQDRPIRLVKRRNGFDIAAAGDVESAYPHLETVPADGSTPVDEFWPRLVDDLPVRIAETTGLPEPKTTALPPADDLDGLWLVTGSVLYAAKGDGIGIAPSLREWRDRDGIDETAFAAVYGLASTEDVADPGTVGVLPLDPDQADAARAARSRRLTVVSGAPGCGKSHTLAAIAHDAVAAGESVLMVTQSPHAADVLADLLARHPGPRPVLFGDSERRGAVAAYLSSEVAVVPGTELKRARTAADQARRLVARAEDAVLTALHDEIAAASARPSDILWFNDFPRLIDPDVDLAEVERRLDRFVRHRDAGHRVRARLARRRLTALVGAPPDDDLEHAVGLASAHRAAARITAHGTDLTDTWRLLHDADDRSRTAAGTALAADAAAPVRRTRDCLRAMAALASALRAGRVGRRAALASIDTRALLTALPLWISTVVDVEDVLPAVAGMFDLVIVDEASHIDQIRAAPALLRARRAVVAGDPRQLRFVSFVGDSAVADVLAEHDAGEFGDRLDVRRQSAYDVASGASPAILLREHYRGVPHLIGFSASKFYGGRVAPVTRHPRNERLDAIDVHHVRDAVVEGGVNVSEVDETLRLLAALIDKGRRDVAVITPFRAQADAVERALLEAYTVEQITDLGLRAGTVHAFQGSEADAVIVVLGIVDGDGPGRRRFVADPNLFNVMITRARHELHVVTSLAGGGGIIGEFLRYAENPPVAPRDGEASDWAAAVADELARADVTVRRSYPVGSWTVDLCVGEGADAVGVICGPHRDGADAHLARQRVLTRAGWRLVDAFASRHRSNPVDAALAILSTTSGPA